MRFLIDECLSLDLVQDAAEAGYEAQHIVRVGKASWQDWNIAAYAGAGDFTLVTNNAVDFRRLYALQPIHAGLIIILPNIDRAGQRQLFCECLEELKSYGDLVNSVLEVYRDEGQVAFNHYDLPADV